MKLHLRGIIEDTDRHGNIRLYYRIKGKKKVRLREKPGTAAFLREYECAEKGIPYGDSPVVSDSTKPVVARSFRWLCQQHFKRAANSVTVDTMSRRRRILEEICVKHGDKPFELLERKHVTAIRDTRIDSPGAANNIVKAISALFAWAIEVGEAKTNPCNGIKRLKSGDGFHTWTLEEIEQYEAKHAPGTTARRALAVFMFTGLRLSDAAILGRQHLNDGWIRIRPGKTRKSSGVEVNVPILPDLAEELDRVPVGQLTFLVTEYGKPFSDKGLGNKMRQWCDEAGLFHCSAHGLRKAGASIAAENGATSDQLKAIFGWTTSQQADLYTRAARRKKLAGDATKLLLPDRNENKSVPPGESTVEKWDIEAKEMEEKQELAKLNGGPGGTRTPNQAVMRRRTRSLQTRSQASRNSAMP
ncbi:tyrosine-type recombinase/integrase [Rhizobium leguminosarum]|uniref:tyrosine-type recombinase/integrase n=1 Tax=Rhizobium leguminosarum TaxID=384 RepID=UPI001030C6D5|nr:tyrosine-type recombinase/integrase [Rhizobium leguminosarum]TAY89021.1 site-specific integrase [Rhizobium leguminosarum]